jgi:hypothetical protein
MTVSLSGLANKTHGAYCPLAFSADFGDGAEGVATAPGGCDGDTDAACFKIGKDPVTGKCLDPNDPDGPSPYGPSDRGPLSGVLLTNPGSCYAKLGRIEPTLKAMSFFGSGAEFTVNTSKHEDDDGFDYWKVSSISVTKGKGYEDGSDVFITRSVGDTRIVDAKATLSVSLEGAPTSVSVTEPGKYYRESLDATPYVANITVTPCGGGSGAEIKATVETDTSEPAFGQITKLSVTKGGDDYLAWAWRETCHTRLNGESVVLRAKEPTELISLHPIKACFGGGACGRVVPVGEREAPEVCVYGSGKGGSISVTLDQFFASEEDDPWRPSWKIASISAAGGENYPDTEAAIITYQTSKATVVVPAAITLSATDGALTGATIDKAGQFYIEREYDGSETPIKIAEVMSGGSGYAKIGRVQPSIGVDVAPSSKGEGATFTPTLQSKKDTCGVDYWYVESIAVTQTVSEGYADEEPLVFELLGESQEEQGAAAYVVAASDPETEREGVAVDVFVTDGGKYYLEDKSIAPYLPAVTVAVTQIPPSVGSGAKIQAVVEDDPNDPAFGQVVKLKVAEGGSGYSLWGGPKDCTYCGPCGITLTYRGVNKEPEVEYDAILFRAADKLVDCNSPPSTATVLHSSIGGGSVSISRGGEYTETQVCPCEPAEDCPCEDTNCPGGGVPVPNPPGCASNPGDETDKCPPCRGECDECNPCGDPCCVCVEGNCELSECCGPCDEENPCPEGCICCNGVCVEEIPEGECCGPCDEENPCPEGCACVDGECVGGGVCCLPDGACATQYTTREECETCKIDCSQIYEGPDPPPECVEDPDSCFDGGGFWQRYTTDLSSCDECTGADVNSCSPIPPGPANPCGTWHPGKTCEDAPCPCDTDEDCGLLGNCGRCVDGECVGCAEGDICCDGSCASPATAAFLCAMFGPFTCDECPDDPP